jgi:hypothetical protein
VITQASELMHEDVADDFKSSKRKRSVDDDASEREQKKVHIADDEVAMDSLHLDVGDLYSVCKTRKAPFTSSLRFAQSLLPHPGVCELMSLACWI